MQGRGLGGRRRRRAEMSIRPHEGFFSPPVFFFFFLSCRSSSRAPAGEAAPALAVPTLLLKVI